MNVTSIGIGNTAKDPGTRIVNGGHAVTIHAKDAAKKYTIQPTILVIIGVTGDLSKRKLLPAVKKILQTVTPGSLRVLGVTRNNLTPEKILGNTKNSTLLKSNFDVYQMNLTSIDDYKKLHTYLLDKEKALGVPLQKLFYLSVPPQISLPIVELLGESGIAAAPHTKLLLEKPFGVDLVSAQELIAQAKSHFAENQIYRIDHYLAKEMTQNLVVFREKNSLFRRTWNTNFIESIDILATEKIGIEGRATFYEQTGALRDLIQSHLLQLAALVLADLTFEKDRDIPQARLKALRQISTPQNIRRHVIRGQYKGYRDEVGTPHSTVETFVSLTLTSKDPRWQNVPIQLTTGKALGGKTTEIRINYRQDSADESNVLILRIQPNEGIEIELWAKEPGYDNELQKVPLKFAYDTDTTLLPEAYERVFMDAIRSDHDLFTTSDEVLETWRILDPIQKAWEMDSSDLLYYEPGVIPVVK